MAVYVPCSHVLVLINNKNSICEDAKLIRTPMVILMYYASDSSYEQLRQVTVAAEAEAARTCSAIGISVFNQLIIHAKLLMTILPGFFNVYNFI